MERSTTTHLLNPETWIRLLYMIVFLMLLAVARMVIWVVAILQFILVLVTGEDNANLRSLGQGVSKWAYQAFLFLTFNSDEKPFPFSDWPEIEELAESATEQEVIVATETEASDDIPTFTAEDQAGTGTGEAATSEKTPEEKPVQELGEPTADEPKADEPKKETPDSGSSEAPGEGGAKDQH